jgi:transcriptional regulator with XRE-family HTH domain
LGGFEVLTNPIKVTPALNLRTTPFPQVQMSKAIGRQIRAIRTKKGLSQKRFGKKIGISGQSVSAYETGKVTPSLSILENISKVYDVDVGRLSDSTKETAEVKMETIKKTLEELRNLLNRV